MKKNLHADQISQRQRSLGIRLTAVSACLVAALLQQASSAQDSQSGDGSPFVLNVPRRNPLEGLFTPQPQYPTSQTLLNPEATQPPPGELNPLKGLFTPQPQFVTPQTLLNPDGSPPDGQVNHLKGLFTPPNQWATPQTLLNPHGEPRHLIPERKFLWGEPDERTDLYRQHNLNTYGREHPLPTKEKSKSELEHAAESKVDAKKKELAAPKLPKRSTEAQGSQKKRSSPISEALFSIASSKYHRGLEQIEKILAQHPDDAQAHYLKAVALVKLRRYKDAATEYRTVLNLQPKESLVNQAREGLRKIGFES